MISISLTVPPSANKSWRPVRTVKGARLVKREAFATWLASAKTAVRLQRDGASIGGPFSALVVLPEMLGDMDNRIKPTLDACQHGGAIANDKHCCSLRVEIDDTRPPGTLLIELTPIPPIAGAPHRKQGLARKEPTP